MSDFIVVMMLTVITALVSLALFAICVHHAPAAENPSIAKAFEELNIVRRKISAARKRKKWKRYLLLILTLWIYYLKTKKQNALGALDAAIVIALASVLVAMTGNGFWNFLDRLLNK